MLDFEHQFTDVEKTFISLPSHELLDLIRELEREARICEQESPIRAYRLYRACNVGTRILRQRIDYARTLRPRPPLCD